MTDGEEAPSKSHAEQSRQLEELLIQRQKWLGDASHELRGPLNAAAMSLNLVTRRDDLPDGVQATLRNAERHLLHMSDLVRDMFDTAKLENDAFELAITPDVPVHEIVEEIVEEFAANPGVLSLRSIPDHTITATLDRDRIRQVVRNVVSNAAKYRQTDKQATIA
ncbi:MAG: histidine kinase dimerization/phospho-acceptor domain-containing protein, partial [Actinomycetota bacterium]|nr:histidine kinase dimerization/phospho-acceptor domain-containing protein [Actinomycetota bacterium]